MTFELQGKIVYFRDKKPGQYVVMYGPRGEMKPRAELNRHDAKRRSFCWAFEATGGEIEAHETIVFACADREVVRQNGVVYVAPFGSIVDRDKTSGQPSGLRGERKSTKQPHKPEPIWPPPVLARDLE